MAWSVVQAKGSSESGNATLAVTLTNTPVTGNKLIAFVSLANSSAETITSVKDGNGNSLTAWGTLASNVSSSDVETNVYFYDVPATPSKVITLTPSAAGSAGMVVQEVSGLLAGNTTACLDGTPVSANSTTSSVNTAAYSTAASNEYLVTFLGDEGGGFTFTFPSPGWTTETNSINGVFDSDACVAYKNSTGGSESASWSTTGADVEIAWIGAFKLAAAGGTAATPKPIVRPRPRTRKGVIWYRPTPPVFKAPTQWPIVRTFVRRNRGSRQVLHELPITAAAAVVPQKPIVRSFLRRNRGQAKIVAPAFVPPHQPPIVRSFLRRNRGQHQVTVQLPIAYPPGPPIVHTFRRRNHGSVQVTYQLPVFVSPPQRPIVHSFVRRNRGFSHVLTFPPPLFVPTQQPIVRTFHRRNRGVELVTYQLPVFVSPPQRPIVHTSTRRNRGFSHLLTFPPPQSMSTQRPVVCTFRRRNRGQVQIVHELPVFSPKPPAPIVHTFRRRNRGFSHVYGYPPVPPPPPFSVAKLTAGTFAQNAVFSDQLIVMDATDDYAQAVLTVSQIIGVDTLPYGQGYYGSGPYSGGLVFASSDDYAQNTLTSGGGP